MPENPWGSTGSGETRQWVPAARQGASGPQRSGGGNGGLIIAIIAAVLAVALLAGVLIWVFSRGGDDSDDHASPTAPRFSGVPTVTETVTEAPAPAPEPEQPEPTVAAPDSGSSGNGGGSSSGNGGSSSGSGSSWRDAGLNYNGWTGYSNATCNGSDTWVYAGGNDSTKVVICRATARDGSTLGLYYRGHAGGQGLERDVDMSSADIADGYFEIPANPAKLIIDGDEMKVYENGSLKKTHSFGQWWYDSQA